MAQENLSVVLHARGDLRLVRNRTLTQTFICKIVQKQPKQLFFVSQQDNRPVPEPGPDGKKKQKHSLLFVQFLCFIFNVG